MNAYLLAFKRYTDFSGRSSRAEYWIFTFLNIIFLAAAARLDHITHLLIPGTSFGLFYILYVLATFIPSLAVAVRRLHDTGRSGWMYLLIFFPVAGAIWLLALFIQKSDPGHNGYDEQPDDSFHEQTVTQETNDTILISLICWSFAMDILFRIVIALDFSLLQVPQVKIIHEFLALLSAFFPMVLTSVIKNRSVRTAAFVVAGLHILFMLWFEAIVEFFRTYPLFT